MKKLKRLTDFFEKCCPVGIFIIVLFSLVEGYKHWDNAFECSTYGILGCVCSFALFLNRRLIDLEKEKSWDKTLINELKMEINRIEIRIYALEQKTGTRDIIDSQEAWLKQQEKKEQEKLD